ncbi:mediator of RNA polymerase II transcription subunit 9 isoform X2 [Triplophysa dalaica]|uniref:mediator of RNA polymerase II transcription subunit 9 isoform X2 n=1 Tax=Triplophysa dalaica TaxID=1582913 RepID=UPI0024DF8DBB|nr:mediator of RNA polymerase II transcription subunit 9 isoform X2 [Triplophysa dalaica]
MCHHTFSRRIVVVTSEPITFKKHGRILMTQHFVREIIMATAVSVEEEADDYSFLPIIHDIIKCMDKDSPDVHQELNKLKTKIQEAREQISAMPGIDMSPALQDNKLRTLREQVRTKNQLLQKYKSLCMFDIPKPS